MAKHPGRPTGPRRLRLILRSTAVLVIVGGLGLAWLAARPATSTFCTGGAPIDEVGAPTAEAARIRWAADLRLEIDIEHPDRTSGSGDRVTATYLLADPEGEPTEPERTHFREIVTERGDDDVWRVVGSSRCERWTGT